MKMKLGVCLAFVLATAGAIHSQGFSSPVTQTSLTAAGQNQRFAVGSTLVNGTTYVAYTASNGMVYIAHDTNGNLQFGSPQPVTEYSQGPINSSGNPALAYDSLSGRLYLTYIVNGNVILDYTTDPSQPFQGRISIVSDGTAVASPGITASNGTAYVGYLASSNAIGICSIPIASSASCSQPSGSFSYYGPGLAVFNGQLYTFFEAERSSHALYYFVSSLNSDGSVAGSTLSTDAASDQTSGQPGAVVVNNSLVVGFRSNDGSTYFDSKTYHVNGGWTSSTSNTVGMNGGPSLVAGVPGATATAFYVGKDVPFYVYTTSSTYPF